MSTSDGGYTIDTTYDDQLRSPMNLALHWSEDARCWEVIVRFRGKRLGVTQVSRLDDLGQTVLDYVALASAEAMPPGGALEESMLPKALPASVEDYAQEVVHGFLCACPMDRSIGECPMSVTVGAIVDRLDAAGVIAHDRKRDD